MSRRDLAHVMTALWHLSGGEAGVAVSVADVDEAIGRGHGDMRTPLNLRSLADEGHVVADGSEDWSLTPDGVAAHALDRELGGR